MPKKKPAPKPQPLRYASLRFKHAVEPYGERWTAQTREGLEVLVVKVQPYTPSDHEYRASVSLPRGDLLNARREIGRASGRTRKEAVVHAIGSAGLARRLLEFDYRANLAALACLPTAPEDDSMARDWTLKRTPPYRQIPWDSTPLK